MYRDLRGWLKNVEKHGQLKYISGVSWDLEMSSLIEIMSGETKDYIPALLFDDVPGYDKGFSTLFGILGSPWRIAMTLGLPEDDGKCLSLLRNWHNKAKSMKLIPPESVSSAPVCANVDVGRKVDLLKFPVPRFHELDGGRYIGTCDGVIMRDPDSGWVNVGTYRVMLLDRSHVAIHVVAGQHGHMIMHQKYFSRGQKMPVAIGIGLDPALWVSAFTRVPLGVSEYDYAGGIKGEPIEVIKGERTGLPLPARAEIVIEGECIPGETADEGPFGEWHGYYANLGLSPVPEPVCEVKAVYYRNNPILTCQSRAIPSLEPNGLAEAVMNSNALWSRLEASGIPGIKGVWCHSQVAGADLFTVVSIEQLYKGHSREVGLIASQFPHQGRYTIVVEEDIDPSDLKQVIWAISTRVKPAESIQILQNCPSNATDPTIFEQEKRKYGEMPDKPLNNSRVVIDACRPLEWKQEWYPVARMSPELRGKLLGKWQKTIADILAH